MSPDLPVYEALIVSPEWSEFFSKSLKGPLRPSSLACAHRWAFDALKTFSTLSLRFSSCYAHLRTFTNVCDEKMKEIAVQIGTPLTQLRPDESGLCAYLNVLCSAH